LAAIQIDHRSQIKPAFIRGNVFDGHAASMQSNRLFASLVLSLPPQLASVFFHTRWGRYLKNQPLIAG
jgi:hypothetical protein